MAGDNDSGLRKKSREDLLLIIRALVEENESLKKRLTELEMETIPAQNVNTTIEVPAKQADSLMTGFEELRASVDTAVRAIWELTRVKAEDI